MEEIIGAFLEGNETINITATPSQKGLSDTSLLLIVFAIMTVLVLGGLALYYFFCHKKEPYDQTLRMNLNNLK